MRPILHPQALDELLRAGKYYSKVGTSVARKFLRQVEAAIDDIGLHPELYHEIRKGFRVRVLKKYRYSIIYDSEDGKIRIYAVAHHKRRTGSTGLGVSLSENYDR